MVCFFSKKEAGVSDEIVRLDDGQVGLINAGDREEWSVTEQI
jgi:hypothetical protein